MVELRVLPFPSAAIARFIALKQLAAHYTTQLVSALWQYCNSCGHDNMLAMLGLSAT